MRKTIAVIFALIALFAACMAAATETGVFNATVFITTMFEIGGIFILVILGVVAIDIIKDKFL